MTKAKTLYLFLGFVLAVILFIFTTSPHDEQYQMNKSSYIPLLSAGKPQRIVSLSPGNTEILFALGAGDRVVGVSSYSDYPAQAKSIPSVGSYVAPDIEKIVSLKPDMVVALKQTQNQHIRLLNQAGIRVVAVDPQNLQEILTAIDTISEAIGEPSRGLALRHELATQLDKVKTAISPLPPKRVFAQIWDNPLLTAGNKSFINDIITQAGGINVAADKNTDYTPCDIEMLYAYNPDMYIIISHSTTGNLSFVHKPELKDVTAIKNQQIFQIEDDLMTRPGPRSFVGLAKLAEILHKGEQ